ncbi:hypothetical protein [Enterococcus alishanensis]|uniref:DUF2187 domain-containing protein n=1 Tax=Enterococcus alishanensis TaxID=1303817 RepID=A0ABS6T885_9ENTE|nr:hypothetical protein [Enterococcus alishanensis]MBV7389069.1 hypothetical protein [Enterococcus alishanensis]
MKSFKIGDGVTPVTGSMKNEYGTIVNFYQEKNQILVRFGSDQQFYFSPEELIYWQERE